MAPDKADNVVIPKTITDINTNRNYSRGRLLSGKGDFAKYYIISDMATGHKYAGKIVSKKLLTKSNQKEKMTEEVNIHRSVNHKHIVGLHGYFEDEEFVYVVLELCEKKTFIELLKKRKALTEPETRYFMKQILDGVLYLHDNGIIHRDLKLSNLLLNDDIEVKIGGFGFATRSEYEDQRKNTSYGYMAPELKSMIEHCQKIDVWSIGCIMYTLLVGKPPSDKKCDYQIPNHVEGPAIDLIFSMLEQEPKNRPTVQQIISSDFFNGYIPSKLPVTCLTVAPKFDSMDAKEDVSLSRRPLAEVNNGGENIPALIPLANNVKSEPFNDYLKTLHGQLQKVLSCKPSQSQSNAERLTDPAAQPLVWISKWFDYTHKYGFGYELCDERVGVIFNDESRIALWGNRKNVNYIERDGTENYYTMGNTPSTLDKKMKLIDNFCKLFMEKIYRKAGPSVNESDPPSCMPYLHTWHITPSTLIMQLTNGTVQMNFNDHTKIIMCPVKESVSYIDNEQNFRTYRFSTIMKNGCNPGLLSCLDHAASKIENLLRSQ